MDYQPQPIEQNSSSNAWYIVGIIVIAALALWYFYGRQAPSAGTESTAVEQTQLSPLGSGDTTADISADLNQVPDASAALDADASASASAISGL